MATKTITIDVEAYGRLKSVQKSNESFSQTIKRVVRKPISTDELARLFDDLGRTFSKESFKMIEQAVAWGRDNPFDQERVNGLFGHNRRRGPYGTQRAAKKSGRIGKAKAA